MRSQYYTSKSFKTHFERKDGIGKSRENPLKSRGTPILYLSRRNYETGNLEKWDDFKFSHRRVDEVIVMYTMFLTFYLKSMQHYL
jgi:hypothetical protein